MNAKETEFLLAACWRRSEGGISLIDPMRYVWGGFTAMCLFLCDLRASPETHFLASY